MSSPSTPPRDRTQVIAVNTLWMGVDSALSFFGALVGSIAVARYLGPEKLGFYAYLMWIVNISIQLGSVGVPTAARKYLSDAMGKNTPALCRAIIKSTYRFQLAAALVLVAAGVLAVIVLVPAHHQAFAFLAVLSLLPCMLMTIPTASNMAMEDLSANVLPSILGSAINLTGIFLTLLFRWDLVGLSASLLTSRSVDFVARHILHRKLLKRTLGSVRQVPLSMETKAEFRRFCLQASVLQAVNLVVWDRSEILFLKHFCPIVEVSYYSTAFNISQQVLFAPQVFAAAAGATLMVRAGEDRKAAGALAVEVLRYTSLLALPLTFGLAALSGPAISIVYGKQYLPAIPALVILAAFSSAKVLLLPAQQLMTAADRQDVLLLWTVVIGCMNLGLDLLLIPTLGAVGAAFANSLSQATATGIFWMFAAKHLGAQARLAPFAGIVTSTLIMASVAASLGALLPAWAAAVAGIPAGGVVFLLCVRVTRVLSVADRERLSLTAARFPAPVQRLIQRALRFLAQGPPRKRA